MNDKLTDPTLIELDDVETQLRDQNKYGLYHSSSSTGMVLIIAWAILKAGERIAQAIERRQA